MIKQSLLLAAATLALAACNKPASETAGDATAATSNAMDATGSAISNAAADIALPPLGRPPPFLGAGRQLVEARAEA